MSILVGVICLTFFQANSSLVVEVFLKNSSLKLIHDVKKVDSFTDKNAQKKEEHVMLSTKHTKQTKYFQDSLQWKNSYYRTFYGPVLRFLVTFYSVYSLSQALPVELLLMI